MRQKGNSMNFMNNNTNPIIIGIDHGYGNIKTAHCCFKTGVAAYDKEPTFKNNLLIYEGKYYLSLLLSFYNRRPLFSLSV